MPDHAAERPRFNCAVQRCVSRSLQLVMLDSRQPPARHQLPSIASIARWQFANIGAPIA
jgi:hypothetical protein